MASRHGAARPSRDGENFARTHHHDADDNTSKVKFDVRNPSALAPDAREEDAVLDADVIGGSHATKRGAVNLDGYDSDSDNDTFNARAESRKKREVNIGDQLDNYDARGDDERIGRGSKAANDDDDDDDMFAAGSDNDNENDGTNEKNAKSTKKQVQFLDSDNIVGQELNSMSGGTVRIDDAGSSDDEDDKEEEGIDDEVGAGGLKRNAPKVEAFNLRAEMEDGRFDEAGNYLRKAGDPDAVHDSWLDGLNKKDLKKAAAAHEKREAEARKQRIEDDSISVSELLKNLIFRLEKAETPLEALARLGKGQQKTTKKIPAWKLKKMKEKGEMDVDQTASAQDPTTLKAKEAINAITDAADKLLSRDFEHIYDQARELLIREYRRETGEDWAEPDRSLDKEDGTEGMTVPATGQWNFRWTDGRDGAEQGPFDGPTMKAWQEAGYFQQGVEFRRVEEQGAWIPSVTFE